MRSIRYTSNNFLVIDLLLTKCYRGVMLHSTGNVSYGMRCLRFFSRHMHIAHMNRLRIQLQYSIMDIDP